MTCSNIWHVIPKCAYRLDTRSMKVGESIFYQTQMSLSFLILFSDIGQCFHPAQTKSFENQKSTNVGIIRIIYPTFSEYFRPIYKLVKATDALQTTDNRQKPKITVRQYI